MKKINYAAIHNLSMDQKPKWYEGPPRFKKGDWILSKDQDREGSWQVAKITKMVAMRKGEFTDYRVEILYDHLGVYNEPYDNWLIKPVDTYSEKMTDMDIKLFKVLYG